MKLNYFVEKLMAHVLRKIWRRGEYESTCEYEITCEYEAASSH